MKHFKYILIALGMLLISNISFGQYNIAVENFVSTKYEVKAIYSDGNTNLEKLYIILPNQGYIDLITYVHSGSYPNHTLKSFKVYTVNCNPTLIGNFIYGISDHFLIDHCNTCMQNGNPAQAIVWYNTNEHPHYLGLRCYFN